MLSVSGIEIKIDLSSRDDGIVSSGVVLRMKRRGPKTET